MKSRFFGVASLVLLLGLTLTSGKTFNPQVLFAAPVYTGQWGGYYTAKGPNGDEQWQMIVQLRKDGRCSILSGYADAPLMSQPYAAARVRAHLMLYSLPRDLSPQEKSAVFVSRLSFSNGGQNAKMEPLKYSFVDPDGQRREKTLVGVAPVINLKRLTSAPTSIR